MVSLDVRERPDTHLSETLPRGLEALNRRRLDLAARPAAVVLAVTLVGDALAVALSLVLAVTVLHIDLVGWALLPVLAWPVALLRAGALQAKRLLIHGVSPSLLMGAAGRVMVLVALLGLAFTAQVDVRQSLRVSVLLLVTTLIARALGSRWLTAERRAGRLRLPVLVRGTRAEVGRYVEMLRKQTVPTYEILAVQVTDGVLDVPGAERVPVTVDPVAAASLNRAAAIVMVGPVDLPSDELRRTIWHAERQGIDTLMLPIVEPVAPPVIAPARGGTPASMAFQGPNRELFGLKRAMDRVLAGLALVLLSPLLGGIAVAVRATSAGPALFRQVRVGRDGREFTMLKFRTMVVDAETRLADLAELNEHAGGTLFKVKNDPRVTGVGRLLRKFSLDELPQLINVVRGEMSLVGPRPPLPDEVANYPVDSMRRFVVSPGLTGLWQVSGRSNLDPIESARLDTQYVENWSFGLDVRILLKTAKVVVTGDGAY